MGGLGGVKKEEAEKMSLICCILGHKFGVVPFPPQQPDSLIVLCLRCSKHFIIYKLDGDYYLEDLEDEVEEPEPLPPNSHIEVV